MGIFDGKKIIQLKFNRVIMERLEIAKQLITNNNLEEAFKLLQDLLKKYPDADSVLFETGKVCFILKKYDSAILYLEKIINSDEYKIFVEDLLLCVYNENNDNKKIFDIYEKIKKEKRDIKEDKIDVILKSLKELHRYEEDITCILKKIDNYNCKADKTRDFYNSMFEYYKEKLEKENDFETKLSTYVKILEILKSNDKLLSECGLSDELYEKVYDNLKNCIESLNSVKRNLKIEQMFKMFSNVISEEKIKELNSIFNKTDTKKIALRKFANIELPIFNFGYGHNLTFEQREKIIDYCMKIGVKYYETAWSYKNSEVNVGKILKKYPRESFYLTDKLPACSGDDVLGIFEEQLKRCQVDYFDFYLIHGVMHSKVLLTDDKKIYDVLFKERQKGRIKHLGFSYHGDATNLEILLKEFKWDYVQLSLNAIDWSLNNAKKIYNIATKNNMPIMVMNPLKGGQLSKLNEEAIDILKKANPSASVVSWGYRFLLSFPNVFLLSRTDTVEQMAENLETFSTVTPLTQKEQEILFKAVNSYNSKGAISCVYCDYCKKCPMNIAISRYFFMYNQYKLSTVNQEQNFIIEYESIPEQFSLNKCIKCGLCKTKCTQHLDIPNILRNISKEYEEIKNKR
jgi:hypothetical protein